MPTLRDLPKPFVKWAGGKEQLLPQISASLPVEFKGYFEPFVGGGAVFFHLHRTGLLTGKAILCDLNQELMIAYQTIRDRVEDLIAELQRGTYQTDEETFKQIRDWDRQVDWHQVDDVRRTARMIYLNKTCYNGLYRVNRQGFFNVPFGEYASPTICDTENLRAVSKALRGVKLEAVDFAVSVKKTKRGDLVYLDPPYDPLSATSRFTAYTKGGFGEKEQRRLASVCQELHERGCLFLMSNSDTPLVHSLYLMDYCHVEVVKAKRAISCDPAGRGHINELLIRNYQNTRQRRIG